MKKFFFGSIGGICAGDKSISTVRNISFLIQPFTQFTAFLFGKFVGNSDFAIACGKNQKFAGKIQIGGKRREFALHGIPVYLYQNLVTGTKRLSFPVTVCEYGMFTLVQWQITIDRIIQADKCCLNVGCNFFYLSYVNII